MLRLDGVIIMTVITTEQQKGYDIVSRPISQIIIDEAIKGKWHNNDVLSFGNLFIRSVSFTISDRNEISIETESEGKSSNYNGIFYQWPGNTYFIIVYHVDQPLKEYYMMAELHKSKDNLTEYLTIDMTGSIRYYQ